MAARLQGKVAMVEKVETADVALAAAETLRGLEPRIGEGPGRKLGL